jgi:hypothetical protein
MTRSLVRTSGDEDADGIFNSQDNLLGETVESPFANLVSVTFSAFDDFSMMPERRNALKGVQYSNVGLRRRTKDEDGERVTITLDPFELADDFSSSAKVCALGESQRRARWTRALTTLQADPIFEEAQVASLADVEESQFGKRAAQLFRKLSSGHKMYSSQLLSLWRKSKKKRWC